MADSRVPEGGMSFQAIADELGLSETMVRKIYKRGLEKARVRAESLGYTLEDLGLTETPDPHEHYVGEEYIHPSIRGPSFEDPRDLELELQEIHRPTSYDRRNRKRCNKKSHSEAVLSTPVGVRTPKA